MICDINERLLTVQEVAEILRVDQTTVRRWVKSGALDAVGLPSAGVRHSYLIKRETLESILDTSRTL